MRTDIVRSTPSQKVELDRLDEQILWELGRDGRIANNALAQKLHVSPSTTLLRMKALRERGVIRSIHADIDLGAVGLDLQAMIFVRLRPQARERIHGYASYVVMLAPVQSVFFMGGGDDFIIHVACTSTSQLRDFVAKKLSMDPAVASTQTHIVFDHFRGANHMDHVDGYEEMRAPLD